MWDNKELLNFLCLNSLIAGSKANMFHIYSQESKSFVMRKQFKWKA